MLLFGASSPGSYLPAKHGYDSLFSGKRLGLSSHVSQITPR